MSRVKVPPDWRESSLHPELTSFASNRSKCFNISSIYHLFTTTMSLPLPGSLTPTKVSAFKECGYAFRLSVIDKIPQPSNPWTVRGTIAHRVLDRLYFQIPRGKRSIDRARLLFGEVWDDSLRSGKLDEALEQLPKGDLEAFKVSTLAMVEGDFQVECPDDINAIGTELMLESTIDGVMMRGIIDRLDLNDDGSLTITDYKTGRIPKEMKEHDKLSGVHFYAMLCEKVLGIRPVSVQLIYLRNATTIISKPTEQSLRALQIKTHAIWRAVQIACERDDFRPQPSKLCSYCCYQVLCPASPSRNDAQVVLRSQQL